MAKKKIKKFLKRVAPLVVAGLGAAALGRRKGKNLGVSGADKGLFTSDSAYMDDTMPPMLTRNMGMNLKRRGSVLADPRINRIDDYYGSSLKKGGRVKGVGKAKRGFGRALKGGK
tara:strand:+ start:41 stop:385 length:345 start_codon:yes stop_codon:yes gene_type:complete